MARQKALLHSYQFNKGLVTDASPLAFPENTCTQLENFLLDTDGSMEVRNGLTAEANVDYTTTIDAPIAARPGLSWTRWNRAVQGLDVFVMKVGHKLYFRTVNVDGVFVTGTLDKEITLTPVAGFSDLAVALSPVSFAPTSGYLLVVGKYIEPCYITLDQDTFDPTLTVITVKERDFDGLDSGYEPTERPTILNSQHNYNLINAGWNNGKISQYKTSRSKYPSLCDLVNFGYQDDPSTGNEFWSAERVITNSSGTSQAVRGSIILNSIEATIASTDLIGDTLAFIGAAVYTHGAPGSLVLTTNVDLTAVAPIGAYVRLDLDVLYLEAGWPAAVTVNLQTYGSLVVTAVTATDITVTITLNDYGSGFLMTDVAGAGRVRGDYDTEIFIRSPEDTRFETTCVWAGRAWYAGVDSGTIGNRLYFSQVFEGPSRFGLCYQEADPASRHITEMIASDGGVIVIPEMGKAISLVPHKNYLVVFTTNGVWVIFGRDGIFDATAYGVRKVSEEVLVNANAAAETETGVVYWSTDSISMVMEDPQAGGVVSKSMSDGVLKNFISGYGPSDWPYIRTYSLIGSRRVAFSLPREDLVVNDKLLWVDLRLGAYYTDTFKSSNPSLPSSVEGLFYQYDVEEEERIKAVVVAIPYGMGDYKAHLCTFSHADTDFAHTGETEEIDAVCVTGHTNGGDASKAKQGTYIRVYMAQETNSSAYVQSIWDYASGTGSNKYSNTQQCFRTKPDHSVAISKLRVRGWGNSLQLKFTNERGKPCRILGWDMELEANNAI